MADQSIPLKISVAPFPEGFQADMDEHAQQLCALMSATVEGQFLTGLVLPPGSTLPSTDVGPIFMGGIWYYWDPVSGQYLPQSIQARPAKNYVKNSCYQVQQTGAAPALTAGVNKTYDMCLCRMTTTGVLTIAADVGPLASADHDTCPAAIKYTVGTVVASPGATEIYAHEHLIEGSDIAAIQGEVLSLSFLCWTNTPGVYSAYLANGVRDASYCATFTIPTANTWTRVKIENIPALPVLTIGTWTTNFSEGVTGLYVGVVMACGSQWQTANLKQWNSGIFMAGATQSNMCSVTNNQMRITAMRLEASPMAGFASVNAFAIDYEECIRYYFTTFSYQSTTSGLPVVGDTITNGAWNMANLFPRRMAKVPMVTPYSWLTKASGLITDLTGNYDIAAATIDSVQKGIVDSEPFIVVSTGTTNSTVNVAAIPSTTALSVGMLVTGSGIPIGATIATIVSSSAITLSAAATSSLTGTALTFTRQEATLTTTGTTATTINVTAIPSTAALHIGMPVTGSGIPAGATIASIVSGSAITLSAAATSSLSNTQLVFSLVAKNDVLWALITADARLT